MPDNKKESEQSPKIERNKSMFEAQKADAIQILQDLLDNAMNEPAWDRQMIRLSIADALSVLENMEEGEACQFEQTDTDGIVVCRRGAAMHIHELEPPAEEPVPTYDPNTGRWDDEEPVTINYAHCPECGAENYPSYKRCCECGHEKEGE